MVSKLNELFRVDSHSIPPARKIISEQIRPTKSETAAGRPASSGWDAKTANRSQQAALNRSATGVSDALVRKDGRWCAWKAARPASVFAGRAYPPGDRC